MNSDPTLSSPSFHLLDSIVLGIVLLLLICVGAYFSRRIKNADGYFLANRSMPGWLVGISMMATMISAMSFLAIPAFTYTENYLWVPSSVIYAFMAVVAMYVFMPFFRRIKTPSGYEYLEKRFGLWARIYLASGFTLFHFLRMGIVLYAISLPFQTISGIDTVWLVVIIGVIAGAYTVAGGLEAVIWTDLFQAVLLLVGALICVPVVLNGIPGGLEQVITEAYDAGKMSLGGWEFDLSERTFWTMLIFALVMGAAGFATNQDVIQRYRAPKSDKQARIAIAVSAFTIVPIWLYFSFLGTALWVFYQTFPDPTVLAYAESAPEKIVPYFVFSHLPAGVGGLVLAGLIMAAMSSLDSSINACSATLTSDFYQRFFAKDKDPEHYLKAGRWFSVAFTCIMIAVALTIHFYRDITLQDLQAIFQILLTAGTFGLMLIGFLSTRVDNRSALTAAVITVVLVVGWIVLDTGWMKTMVPSLEDWVPNKFWLPAIANVMIFVLAILISRITGRRAEGDLTNLTLKTLEPEEETKIA